MSKHHRRWLQRQTCPLTAWRLEAASPRSGRAGLFLPRAEGDVLQAPLLRLVASGVPWLAGGIFCLCTSACRFPLVIRTQSPRVWPALTTSSQFHHLRRPHFQTRSHSQVLGVTTSGGGHSTQNTHKEAAGCHPCQRTGLHAGAGTSWRGGGTRPHWGVWRGCGLHWGVGVVERAGLGLTDGTDYDQRASLTLPGVWALSVLRNL